jgi:hypothetical protein
MKSFLAISSQISVATAASGIQPNSNSEVKVKVTLRLAVYLQSVHLVVKLLETHDQSFFSN